MLAAGALPKGESAPATDSTHHYLNREVQDITEQDFEQIATRYRELDTRRLRLGARQGSLLYNTEGNSHHPRAFSRLEDASLHRQLEQEITEIDSEKRNLAFDAQHRGFPEERWIKVEGPKAPDDEATGIKLAEHDNGHCELMIEDWALVLAEG